MAALASGRARSVAGTPRRNTPFTPQREAPTLGAQRDGRIPAVTEETCTQQIEHHAHIVLVFLAIV